jgi:hypothetical protein
MTNDEASALAADLTAEHATKLKSMGVRAETIAAALVGVGLDCALEAGGKTAAEGLIKEWSKRLATVAPSPPDAKRK